MPKRTTTTSASLQIFAIDWLLVIVGVLWLLALWSYGASQWQVMLLGFGSVFWWVFGNWWALEREKITGKSVFSLSQISQGWSWWWLVWLGVVCSTLITSHIPIKSAVVVFWWLMSGLWFWWWSSLVDDRLREWLVVHIMCGGLFCVVILNWLVAWWQPQFVVLSALSLSPNFVVPFFGHHHIAALIVLIWPLLWLVKQFWQFDQRNWQHLMALWLVGLGATIWFAFSRSAWLAVLLQAGIFFWLHRGVIKQNFKVWLLSGVIFVLLLVAGFLLKDLMQSQRFVDLPKPIRSLCYQWWAPSSLCSVAPEPRLEYWQQSLAVWRAFPWFGSGLDTFGQISKRLQTNTLFQTQYPHQVFLQVAAEQGIFGLMVWSGFWILLIVAFYRHWQQKITLQYWPVWLAIFGAVVIGNLDFDWQLAGFWWPFLMVVSCVGVVSAQNQNTRSKFLRVMLYSGLFLAMLWATLSAMTYFQLSKNQADTWVKVWPYSAEWQSLMTQQIRNKSLWQEVVKKHYRHSPEVWFGAMTSVNVTSERWQWFEQLWLIDPWRYWDANPLDAARKNQDLTQINLVLDRLNQWLDDHPESKVQKYNPAFAAELLELGDQSLQQENWELAQKTLKLAQVFDPWILHNRMPSIVGTRMSPEKAPAVLQIFAELKQDGYGDSLSTYRSWYQQQVLAHTKWLLQRRRVLVGDQPLSERYLPEIKIDMRAWVYQVRQLGQQSLVLLPDPQSRGFELSEKLAELLIEAGDATVGTQAYQVSELYQLAQKIEPWSLNGQLWWFERMDFVKPDTAEFLRFGADWSQAEVQVTGYKPQAWMLFYNRTLLLSLRSGNMAAAFDSARSMVHYWNQALAVFAL